MDPLQQGGKAPDEGAHDLGSTMKEVSTVGYEKIIDRAHQLDPKHESRAEVHKVSDSTYPYAAMLVMDGTGAHRGTTIVQGLTLEAAEDICARWNAWEGLTKAYKVYKRNGLNCVDLNGTYTYLPEDLSKTSAVCIEGEYYIQPVDVDISI